MYTMLRVIYTNLDALVAAIAPRSREMLKIEISYIVVFLHIFVYILSFSDFLKRVLVIFGGVISMNRDELRTQEACILYLQFDSLKCKIRAKLGVENDEKRKNTNFEKSSKIVIFNKKPPN